MQVYDNILQLIGNTPMVKVQNLDTGPCELYIKLESHNPGGSIKDRIAIKMIEAAEKEGKLKPGGTIIEATAGNTGIGLALVAAIKGYRLLIVLPDKMSKEKIFHLKAFGADVVMTRSDVSKGHPEYYQDLAESMASKMDNSFYVNQFANEINPLAHEETTAKEVWEQMEGKLDTVVLGVGTGGTVSGLTQYLKKIDADIDIILADPKGSILADYVNEGILNEKAGTWLVEGIGEDFIPSICDLSKVKKAYSVNDKDAFLAARELLQKEGIFTGSSSGAMMHATLQYCREQTQPKRVVTFACDSGNKYLTKFYNDYWMLDQGFLERKTYGDLRDVISRLHAERAVISVGPEEPLSSAYSRMKMHDVSQLPVLEDNKLLGILNETDLLIAVTDDHSAFQTPVHEVMSTELETISYKAQIKDLVKMFKHHHVVIIMDNDDFLGLITRLDLVTYLRRKLI